MIKIRYGTFETNSSSVHTLCWCNDDEYKKLVKKELYINEYEGNFVTKEQAIEELKEAYEKYGFDSFSEAYHDYIDCTGEFTFTPETFNAMPDYELEFLLNEFCELRSLDSILDGEYYEGYESSYTTEHGDKVHVFGYYGNDR